MTAPTELAGRIGIGVICQGGAQTGRQWFSEGGEWRAWDRAVRAGASWG